MRIKEATILEREAHLAALVTESERFHEVIEAETRKQIGILDRISKKVGKNHPASGTAVPPVVQAPFAKKEAAAGTGQ